MLICLYRSITEGWNKTGSFLRTDVILHTAYMETKESGKIPCNLYKLGFSFKEL